MFVGYMKKTDTSANNEASDESNGELDCDTLQKKPPSKYCKIRKKNTLKKEH